MKAGNSLEKSKRASGHVGDASNMRQMQNEKNKIYIFQDLKKRGAVHVEGAGEDVQIHQCTVTFTERKLRGSRVVTELVLAGKVS